LVPTVVSIFSTFSYAPPLRRADGKHFVSRSPAAAIIIYNNGMRPALFLDRDGVIIENRDAYVRSWEDVAFLPGALQALAALSASPFAIVIVTNQSAVGRGLIPLARAEAINRGVVDQIEKSGGRVDGVFICPHAPGDACSCRKPLPGLLLQAADALHLDLSQSVMVGDAVSDLMAGQNAGVRRTFLVRTGRGAAQALLPEAALLQPFAICDALSDVVACL
jgi:D-glycero-D-manno-heptose 1,7-bisphosphate phosphatase